MKQEYKTIDQLIEEKNNFISSIPDLLGINLCNVIGIDYFRQEDNQLKHLTIVFKPSPEEGIEAPVKSESTFVDRLGAEKSQLEDRLSKLEAFIETQKYNSLSFTDRMLLQSQRDVMWAYYRILNLRMSTVCPDEVLTP